VAPRRHATIYKPDYKAPHNFFNEKIFFYGNWIQLSFPSWNFYYNLFHISTCPGSVTNNSGFCIEWLDLLALLLQLQPIITAHNQWLPKTRSIPYWTTSSFSSTVMNDDGRITYDWTELSFNNFEANERETTTFNSPCITLFYQLPRNVCQSVATLWFVSPCPLPQERVLPNRCEQWSYSSQYCHVY
jgi:hypothetical protein